MILPTSLKNIGVFFFFFYDFSDTFETKVAQLLKIIVMTSVDINQQTGINEIPAMCFS